MKFLKLLKSGSTLTYLHLAITVVGFIVEGLRDEKQLEDKLEKKYGLEPIEKESDK